MATTPNPRTTLDPPTSSPGRQLSVAERGDRVDRDARPGERWTAAYWPMLGNAAPSCGPGDYPTARSFVAKLEAAIDRGGWTRNEWRNLHKLYAVWSRRANGQDPRFDLVGVRAGRLPRAAEAWVGERHRIFQMREWIRVARPLQMVDSLDPHVRPSDSTLRARARSARARD